MPADNSPYVKPSPAREQEMQEVVDRLVDADTDEEDDKREWVRPRPPTGGTVEHRWPFMIGSDVWPGIAKLAEECGEVVQVVGKIIALAGAENYTHWDGSDVRERLLEEMADVTAAIQFVWAHNLLGERQAFEQRVEEKFGRFQQWHAEGKRNSPQTGRQP